MRFTIREWFLVTAIVGLSLAWGMNDWVLHGRLKFALREAADWKLTAYRLLHDLNIERARE